MKSKIFFVALILLPAILFGEGRSKIIKLQNQLNKDRVDGFVSVSSSEIKKEYDSFDINSLKIFDGEKEIPFQIEKNKSKGDQIIFVVDIKAKSSKEIKFTWGNEKQSQYISRTYAELAMKKKSFFDGKKFHGTKFENVTRVKVPSNHTDHDALFKYEGPGWESEKVGYRFYLDWRNATDIFGKKVNQLVLKNVGVQDTLGNDDDSYHSMQSWGMDIFKVGKSLGIGSLGMMTNKVEMISKTDSIICAISKNGPVKSEVKTNYYGWQVGDKKFNVESRYSIVAGSRLSKHAIVIDGDPDNLVTGLAKHEGTNYIKSNNGKGWNYIALYGKQSLAGDNLGIAIFFKQKDLIEITKDNLSNIVKLKPTNGKLEYYFGAAWQQEYNGIKSQNEFEKFLIDTVDELNNSIKVEY